ncbi:MAG: hypothetical protein FH749_07850 [Firmicutes bacterium]|nr:hypothetical protein [Bacillota bacterium]
MAKPGFIKVEMHSKELDRQIKKALARSPHETAKAVTECILDLSAASAKAAPIESGDLRNNCHGQVQRATVFKDQQPAGGYPSPGLHIQGEVSYSLPYALRQHEDLTLRHDRTDGHKIMTGKNAGRTINMVAGGQAKYLEQPFEQRLPRYIRRVQRIVTDILR